MTYPVVGSTVLENAAIDSVADHTSAGRNSKLAGGTIISDYTVGHRVVGRLKYTRVIDSEIA